jgi:hypothetical protein
MIVQLQTIIWNELPNFDVTVLWKDIQQPKYLEPRIETLVEIDIYLLGEPEVHVDVALHLPERVGSSYGLGWGSRVGVLLIEIQCPEVCTNRNEVRQLGGEIFQTKFFGPRWNGERLSAILSAKCLSHTTTGGIDVTGLTFGASSTGEAG